MALSSRSLSVVPPTRLCWSRESLGGTGPSCAHLQFRRPLKGTRVAILSLICPGAAFSFRCTGEIFYGPATPPGPLPGRLVLAVGAVAFIDKVASFFKVWFECQ